MRTIEIDLAQPFEGFLETVLSLPAGFNNAGGNRLENEVELKQAIRRVYEAANRRLVETKSGLVAIAPPIALFLKKKPFHVATQVDFLITAATRNICGPQLSKLEMQHASNITMTHAVCDGDRYAQNTITPQDRGHTAPLN